MTIYEKYRALAVEELKTLFHSRENVSINAASTLICDAVQKVVPRSFYAENCQLLINEGFIDFNFHPGTNSSKSLSEWFALKLQTALMSDLEQSVMRRAFREEGW